MPLSEPSPAPLARVFDAGSARNARSWAVRRAGAEGFDGIDLEAVEIIAGELIINSVTHGGGTGIIRVWSTPDTVVCEVSDHGWLKDPLAGRRRPDPLQVGGRGLWIINQFSVLQQIRSSPKGTVIRAHIARSTGSPH